ncbi:hypothetical protein CWI38_0490p0020 [Hamiltosporidium tvaerminnensis]|uniref:Uncharacterized protein n=1 Tax=Hamiltosporidium tvaerminnensis TaxID=1176355 RepID=A0A4Q9LY65_9MICR|nr:hypothetical protein CWI38_0490p0020 [Hamiltosporidium tvaerminnensis]
MTNRHQDVIDYTSLEIPFVKVFFKIHLEIIKRLFKQCILKTIEKQITNEELLGGENFINVKIIYRSLFLNFFDIFINRYVISFGGLKFLNDHEFTIYKYFLLNEKFSDPDIIKGLDEIKNRSINEISLITEEKKIKIIQSIINDEKFIKFLIEKVFLVFIGFKNLNKKFLGLSVYDFKKNIECSNSEIEKNQFRKILKKIYTKNNLECLSYYDNAISQTGDKFKRDFYDSLIYAIAENHFNEEFFKMPNRKMFTSIIDCENMHYTFVIRYDSNFVSPKELKPSFIKFSNSYLRRFSDRILYLSLFLKFDDWIVVFIDQIFLNLKEKAFIYFLKQDLSDIKTDRQKQLDEIFRKQRI